MNCHKNLQPGLKIQCNVAPLSTLKPCRQIYYNDMAAQTQGNEAY